MRGGRTVVLDKDNILNILLKIHILNHLKSYPGYFFDGSIRERERALLTLQFNIKLYH